MGVTDKKEHYVFLSEHDKGRLIELQGFLRGLNTSGKDVPGLWTFKKLMTEMKEAKK